MLWVSLRNDLVRGVYRSETEPSDAVQVGGSDDADHVGAVGDEDRASTTDVGVVEKINDLRRRGHPNEPIGGDGDRGHLGGGAIGGRHGTQILDSDDAGGLAVETLNGPGVEPVSEGMTLNRVRDGKPGGDGTCRGCHGVAHRHAGEGVACAFVGLLGASSVQEEPADKDQSAGSTGLGYQDSSEATVVGQSPAGVVRPPGFGPWAHPSTARAHALRSSPTVSRASHAPAPPLRATRS